MYGTDEHYGEQQIYRYIHGLVSIEASESMEKHMCECDECLLKTVQARHQMIQGCAKVSGLFEKYFNKTLDVGDCGFVETHLISCGLCADEYGILVEMKSNEKS